MTKICSMCGEEKDVSDFYRRETGKLRSNCKKCHHNPNIKSKKSLKKEEEIKNNIKICRKCKESKPLSSYYKRTKTLYRNECKDCVRQQVRKHYEDSEEYREAQVVNARSRYHKGKKYQIERNLRRRLHHVLVDGYKVGSAVRDLGCTIDELKAHLESQFQENMDWNNYGKGGWEIDHIVPLSSFDLTDREQLLKACHYTNLQPLWGPDNRRKHNKIKETD